MDKRADSVNDKGEVRGLRHEMGEKEFGGTSDIKQHINTEKLRTTREGRVMQQRQTT